MLPLQSTTAIIEPAVIKQILIINAQTTRKLNEKSL